MSTSKKVEIIAVSETVSEWNCTECKCTNEIDYSDRNADVRALTCECCGSEFEEKENEIEPETELTTETVGNVHNFILTVNGTHEALTYFEKVYCVGKEIIKTSLSLEVQISIEAKKLILTGKPETRDQIIGRIANSLEEATIKSKVEIVSFM